MNDTVATPPPSAGGLAVGALVALAAGASLSAAGQVTAPLHLLTHEWVQSFAPVGGLMTLIVGSRLGRLHSGDVAGALAVAWALMLGLGGLTGHLAWNAAVHGCRTAAAPVYFWSVWIPVALLTAAAGVGLASRERPVRWIVGGSLAVVAACVVHDVGQALVGVRIVDPVIGEVLAFDQRANLDLRPSHLVQRGWLLAVAAALWSLVRLRWDRSEGALWTSRVAVVATIVGTLLGGSHLGLGWSKAALRSELDRVLETEHFVIRYAGGGQAELHVDAIAREAEWELHRLTEAWDVEPWVRIRLQVYDHNAALQRISGSTSARAGLNWVDMRWWDAFDDTLAHELVHALHWTATPNPAIVASRFHLEGTAVAWAEDLTVLPAAHAQTAGALQSGKLPPLAALLSTTGFVDLPERIAYDASGSALGFVVHAYGWETLQSWQQSLSVPSAFGKPVEELDAEWRAFLADVPVGLNEVAKARERFDTSLYPSYRDRRCPKLGRSTEPAHALAERQLKAGNPAAALATYEALLSSERARPQWTAEAAKALSQLGRRDEARALLAEARADLPDDQAAKLWDLERAFALRDRDWPAVEAALLARLALEPDATELQTLLDVLTQEVLREPVAEALLADRATETGDRLLALRAEHPELEALTTLALGRLVLTSQAYRRELDVHDAARLERFLALLPEVPEACDARRAQLARVGQQLVRGLHLDDAQQVADALQSRCTHPRAVLAGQKLAARIAWERAQPE